MATVGAKQDRGRSPQRKEEQGRVEFRFGGSTIYPKKKANYLRITLDNRGTYGK